MEEYRFQVNLGGMIEILSDHLYSSPDVYIRELLQNGVDAIVGRGKSDAVFQEKKAGRLLVTLEEGKSLSFDDNGVGLTEEEIHQFLAIIGESSKKDLESGKIFEDYIGRFGIGLLSCFMVSDSICIRTKSIHSDKAYQWIGKPDGTYTLEEYSEDKKVGTEIFLEAKPGCESYFERERVESLILHYGLILPYPILLDDGINKKRLNPAKLPWDKEHPDKDEMLLFGRLMFQIPFMDCVPLYSEEGGVEGVAYFLPYTVQPSAKQKHLIYLKNMLLTEKGENILPDWAVFTKCIINAKRLRPTASREGFYEDETLEAARQAIGNCIAEYLKHMAKADKRAFHQFLEIHDLVVRSIAIEDDELFELFMDELDFETTKGKLTGLDLRMLKEPLLYCGLNEYRQLSQIFVAQGRLLINAGYVYTLELLRKMETFCDVTVTPVNIEEVDDLLKDVSIKEAEDSVDFLKIAERVLAPYQCEVEMKQFIPANLPAFYYLDKEAQLYQELRKVQEEADDLFGDMLGSFASELEDKKHSILYFNMRNPIVKKMIVSKDNDFLEEIILILYVQTLLIGGFTLRNNELGIMNDKLLTILERGL